VSFRPIDFGDGGCCDVWVATVPARLGKLATGVGRGVVGSLVFVFELEFSTFTLALGEGGPTSFARVAMGVATSARFLPLWLKTCLSALQLQQMFDVPPL
jgi:hypothetical protein